MAKERRRHRQLGTGGLQDHDPDMEVTAVEASRLLMGHERCACTIRRMAAGEEPLLRTIRRTPRRARVFRLGEVVAAYRTWDERNREAHRTASRARTGYTARLTCSVSECGGFLELDKAEATGDAARAAAYARGWAIVKGEPLCPSHRPSGYADVDANPATVPVQERQAALFEEVDIPPAEGSRGTSTRDLVRQVLQEVKAVRGLVEGQEGGAPAGGADVRAGARAPRGADGEPLDEENLAVAVVDYLMRPGGPGEGNRQAARLVLEMEDGTTAGGWGRGPLVDRLAEAFRPLVDALEDERAEHAVTEGLLEAMREKFGPFVALASDVCEVADTMGIEDDAEIPVWPRDDPAAVDFYSDARRLTVGMFRAIQEPPA